MARAKVNTTFYIQRELIDPSGFADRRGMGENSSGLAFPDTPNTLQISEKENVR